MRVPGSLFLVAVLLSGCVANNDAPAEVVPTPAAPCQAPACHEVTVNAIEYAFQPDEITVPAGSVRFVVTNSGAKVHNLKILGGDVDASTLNLAAGVTGFLDASLKPRKYDFYCSITGHAERGMRGTLTVTP